MEILEQFWWVIVAAVVIMVLIALIRNGKAKQKVADQYKRDESIILNVYNKIGSHEIREYMALPTLESRLSWLKLNFPEVMEAVARRYSENDYGFPIADNLDMRLVTDYLAFADRRSAIRRLRNTTIAMSLNEYQLLLDKQNEEYRKEEERRAVQKAKRLAAEAAAVALQQKAAKKYWKSLTKEQKTAFKQARGATARKRVLPAASTDYSMDTLYPFIMATQFGGINPNTNQSLDYCESLSHGHSSVGSSGHHFDGGSHSYDGGGSFDGGGGSSGGDGGGGGGGGGE